jgi:drug/metabolite transporter (DMT)-like permease
MIQSVKTAFTLLPPSAQGAIWMTLSAVFFAAQAGIVRYLSKDLHFIEISFFRALFGIVVMLPWLMRSGVGVLRTSHTKLYVTRGLLSTIAMYGWFGSLTLIPIGDATAISFTFPLFIALAGVLLLKEPAHATRWIALAVGFAGTLIVVRPGFQEVNIGVFMVIGGGVCIAFSAMILKVMLRTDTPDKAAIYQSIYMLPFAFVAVLFVWEWPTPEQWFWGFMLGAGSTTAQRLYSRAFATGDVGSITPFDFTRLPFAIAIGFVIFSELPDVWTIVGGVVIFCSSVFAGQTESRRDRKKLS